MYKKLPSLDSVIDKTLFETFQDYPLVDIANFLLVEFERDSYNITKILCKLLNLIANGKNFGYSTDPLKVLFDHVDELEEYESVLDFLRIIAIILYQKSELRLSPDNMNLIIERITDDTNITYLSFLVLLNYSYSVTQENFNEVWGFTYAVIAVLEAIGDKSLCSLLIRICLNIIDYITVDEITSVIEFLLMKEDLFFEEYTLKFFAYSLKHESIYINFRDVIFRRVSFCDDNELVNALSFWRIIQSVTSRHIEILKNNIIPKYFLLLYDKHEHLIIQMPNMQFLYMFYDEIPFSSTKSIQSFFHSTFIKYLNECICTDSVELKEITINVLSTCIRLLSIDDVRYLLSDNTVQKILIHFLEKIDDENCDCTLLLFIVKIILLTFYNLLIEKHCTYDINRVFIELSLNNCIRQLGNDCILQIFECFDNEDNEMIIMAISVLAEFIDTNQWQIEDTSVIENTIEMSIEEQNAIAMFGPEEDLE